MNKDTTTKTGPDFQTLFSQFEKQVEEYLGKKAPSLPANVKEAIVKYSPYLSLVFVVFSLPAILFALGLGALLTPFAYLNGFHYGASFSLTSLVLLVSLVLEVMAIPGLFARKLSAWKLVYYGVLVNAVYSLLNFNLGDLIIGTTISLYFLVQVKSYYKN